MSGAYFSGRHHIEGRIWDTVRDFLKTNNYNDVSILDIKRSDYIITSKPFGFPPLGPPKKWVEVELKYVGTNKYELVYVIKRIKGILIELYNLNCNIVIYGIIEGQRLTHET